MESFLFSAWERGGKRVIVVAHGGTMMAILSRYADEPRDYYDWLVGNCCGYRIDVRFPAGKAGPMELCPHALWGNVTVTGRANAPFPPKAPGQ
jgi:broad specificity phosphatase PhoE